MRYPVCPRRLDASLHIAEGPYRSAICQDWYSESFLDSSDCLPASLTSFCLCVSFGRREEDPLTCRNPVSRTGQKRNSNPKPKPEPPPPKEKGIPQTPMSFNIKPQTHHEHCPSWCVCILVRPCTATMDAPLSSNILANDTVLSTSSKTLILTVIGTLRAPWSRACFARRTIRSTSSLSSIRIAP
jgi:hypothetical protein